METRWPSQALAVPSNAIECPVHPMLSQGPEAHVAVCYQVLLEYWKALGHQRWAQARRI